MLSFSNDPITHSNATEEPVTTADSCKIKIHLVPNKCKFVERLYALNFLQQRWVNAS